MPRDALAAALYGRLLLPPSLPMPGICDRCRNIVSEEHMRCYRCATTPNSFDVVSPLSYAIGGGRLHTMLRGYKDDASVLAREDYTRSLASILDEHLDQHERCLAHAAGVDRFDLVTVVPSSTPARDRERAQLRRLVGHRAEISRERFAALIRPTSEIVQRHQFDPRRYEPLFRIDGDAVLLVDDMWTTGSAAQSAAAALRRAGASTIVLVVLGRFLNATHAGTAAHLDDDRPGFDWSRCALPSCAADHDWDAAAPRGSEHLLDPFAHPFGR